MIEPHEGTVELRNTFAFVHRWLSGKAGVVLTTSVGTQFTAQAGFTKRGSHAGEPVIRFFQGGIEFGRAYECCWGHYYNCNRTRVGMYCRALDSEVG